MSTLTMSTASMNTAREFRPIAFPRPTTPPARLRLTRRGRLVIGALIVLPLLGTMGAVAANGIAAVATASAVTTDFDYVTVQAGESLWVLAETIAPDSNPRDVIAEIVRLNNLPSSSVQAGQTIAIPAAYSR